jgi:hypothetical protein
MANSFSYIDLMIDGLYGTKVLISPALMGRDELSGSIFRQHFLLVTSPDSDGTVLPFDRGQAKLLTASDSGSSWSDGVNVILMQQEPNSPKQDYWN